MPHTLESIADLIAAHRDGAVSTLALYDKLRFLAAGCATLEKERHELQAELAFERKIVSKPRSLTESKA